MDLTRTSHSGERALVLGGGGSTGNAWLIGVVAGLADAGVDVTTADLTIGTSAGSTAAAQLGWAAPTELFRAVVDTPVPPAAAGRGSGPGAPGGPGAFPGGGGAASVTAHLERITAIVAAAQDGADMRRRLGAAALELEAASGGQWSARWRQIVAARLPDQAWPERRVLITAVDAETGEPVVFDRDSGVELVDAVAASCASSLPYRIAGRPHLDGGYRSTAENADLAAGCARVLVLAPFGGRTLHRTSWGTDLAAQVEGLRAGGAQVEVLVPSPATEHFFGVNAMDATQRPAAARAGYDVGRAEAERVATLWG
jgi:NTE family protein